MDPDVRKFVLRLKLRKKLGSVVQNCAMFLREVLHRQGEIVQGYATTTTGERIQYFWVEDKKGNVYDVCLEVVKATAPASIHEFLGVTLSKEEEEGKSYEKIDDEILEQFKQYQDEPSKFWKSIPRL